MKKLIFLIFLLPFLAYGQTTPITIQAKSDGSNPVKYVPFTYVGKPDGMGNLADLKATAMYVTIAQLRAFTGVLPTNNFYITDAGKQGLATFDPTDELSSDDGVTVFVTAGSRRVKRVLTGVVASSWWGDLGDGSHDDAAAINSALSYIGAHGGGVVRVKSGTHIVTSTLLPISNTIVQGDGIGATVIKIKDHLTAGTVASISVMQTTGDNIIVKDLTIDGNRQNQSWIPAGSANYGLAVSSTNTVVQNCEFKNVTGNGTGVPSLSKNITFDHIFSHDNGKKGLHSGTVENIVITNSVFHDNEIDSGIGLHQGMKKATITNNTSYNNGTYGIHLGDSQGKPSYDLIVTGNKTYHNTICGIYLNGDNVTPSPKDSTNMNKNAIIANNVLINDIMQIAGGRNISIQNNTIDTGQIYVQVGFNIDIKNNNIYHAKSDYAIKLATSSLSNTNYTTGDQINISGNRIVLDTSDYAVIIAGHSNVRYVDNIIQGRSNTYPIRIYDNLSTFTLKTLDRVRIDAITYSNGYNNSTITANSTANRPLNPKQGEQYFDTSLGRVITWTGTAWLEGSGQAYVEVTSFVDANDQTYYSQRGLFPFTFFSGSSNFPNGTTGTGIRVVRTAGSAIGLIDFARNTGADSTLYYRVGTGASSFSPWKALSSTYALTNGLAAKVDNVMTGQGDLIVGGTSGVPTRKAGTGSTVSVLHGGTTLTWSQIQTADITNNAVQYGKIQAVGASSRILGSSSSGTAVTEISLGSGLSMSGTTLSSTGSGGTVTGGTINWPGTLYTTPTTGTVSSGTLTFAPALATQTANRFLAGPTTGAAAIPTFRTIGIGNDIDTTSTGVRTVANSYSLSGMQTKLTATVNDISADYVITTNGTTITAKARRGGTLSDYSGTDAYTVIQAAIDALTPSTTRGNGGGRIVFGNGTYTLTNELLITNWENQGSSNPGYAQLTLEANPKTTKFVQNTSAKNGIVLKNNVSVSLSGLRIECGSSARSALRLDGTGTDEISVFGGKFDNLYLISASSSYPALYAANFFDTWWSTITAQNTNYDAIILENVSTTTLYGNSHFSFIRAIASTSTPYAGLRMKSTDGAGFHALDLMSFDNFECVSSYYGIKIEDGAYNTFDHVDVEYGTVGVSITGGTFARGNTFNGGLISVNATLGTDIEASRGGNSFNNVTLGGGTSVKPINDSAPGSPNFEPANKYDISLANNNSANMVYNAGRTNVTWRYWSDGRTKTNFSDDVTFAGVAPKVSALTASTIVGTDASKVLNSITVGSGLSLSGGTLTATGSSTAANPTASVGVTAVNGSATTYMRSDAAPKIDSTVVRTVANSYSLAGMQTKLNGYVQLQTTGPSAQTGAIDVTGSIITASDVQSSTLVASTGAYIPAPSYSSGTYTMPVINTTGSNHVESLTPAATGFARVILVNNTQLSNTGNTTENTLFTGTIPANSIGIDGSYEIILLASCTNNANAKTINVKIGGTTIANITNLASNAFGKYYITIHNRHSASSQFSGNNGSQAQIGFGVSTLTPTTYTFNTATNLTLTITAQNGNSGDTISIEAFRLVAIP